MDNYTASYLKRVARKNAKTILSENMMYKMANMKESKENMMFDIFIAHSKLDQDIIEGLYIELKEKYKMNVYVDWIVDTQLSRNNITANNVLTIKKRMNNSSNMIYAVSNNMLKSVWTPWELGYFDGNRKPIYVLPILNDYETDYHGAEFVGVYEVIEKSKINTLTPNLDDPKFFD